MSNGAVGNQSGAGSWCHRLTPFVSSTRHIIIRRCCTATLVGCRHRLDTEVPKIEAPMSDSPKTLTRHDLYEAAYQKAGLSRSETTSLVELVLKEITDVVVRGETVKLASFGNFAVRQPTGRLKTVARARSSPHAGRPPLWLVAATTPARVTDLHLQRSANLKTRGRSAQTEV